MASPEKMSSESAESSGLFSGDLVERVKKIKALAKVEMTDDRETRRVEIIMLKYKEEPRVIDDAVHHILHGTDWPYKLTIFDNRLNSANTSKIWNKLISESTCDYVLLIDSDAYVPMYKSAPCWLTRMMESIETTGIVVPTVDNAGGVNKGNIEASYPKYHETRGVWAGMCFLFKKSLWRAHRFDEDFYIYGQDSEWAFRMAKEEKGAIQRDDVLVHHLGSYSWKKANSEGEVDREADKAYAASLYRLKTSGKVK